MVVLAKVMFFFTVMTTSSLQEIGRETTVGGAQPSSKSASANDSNETRPPPPLGEIYETAPERAGLAPTLPESSPVIYAGEPEPSRKWLWYVVIGVGVILVAAWFALQQKKPTSEMKDEKND